MSDPIAERAAAVRRPPEQPELDGVDTNTKPMWAIAFLPLVGVLIGRIPSSFNGFAPDVTPTGVVLNAITIGLSVALGVVAVVLAVLDRRVLSGRGIIRPMHPAWEILDPVYVIGRAVVVRRRVHGSLSPLWVWIGATVVATVLNNLPK